MFFLIEVWQFLKYIKCPSIFDLSNVFKITYIHTFGFLFFFMPYSLWAIHLLRISCWKVQKTGELIKLDPLNFDYHWRLLKDLLYFSNFYHSLISRTSSCIIMALTNLKNYLYNVCFDKYVNISAHVGILTT